VKPTPAETPVVTTTPPPKGSTAERDALRKSLEQSPTTPTAPAVTPEAHQAQKEAAAKAENERKAQAQMEKQRREDEKRAAKLGAGRPLPPLGPAPESRLPKSKNQRLAELLERYRRDELTPADYHAQRGKILAEPNL